MLFFKKKGKGCFFLNWVYYRFLSISMISAPTIKITTIMATTPAMKYVSVRDCVPVVGVAVA